MKTLKLTLASLLITTSAIQAEIFFKYYNLTNNPPPSTNSIPCYIFERIGTNVDDIVLVRVSWEWFTNNLFLTCPTNVVMFPTNVLVYTNATTVRDVEHPNNPFLPNVIPPPISWTNFPAGGNPIDFNMNNAVWVESSLITVEPYQADPSVRWAVMCQWTGERYNWFPLVCWTVEEDPPE